MRKKVTENEHFIKTRANFKDFKRTGFITVNELAKLTFTSPSSIRRDLTFMQNGGLVVRTHGGVSLPPTA